MQLDMITRIGIDTEFEAQGMHWLKIRLRSKSTLRNSTAELYHNLPSFSYQLGRYWDPLVFYLVHRERRPNSRPRSVLDISGRRTIKVKDVQRNYNRDP